MFLGMWELIFSHLFEPFAHIMLEEISLLSLLLMELNLFCLCLVPSCTFLSTLLSCRCYTNLVLRSCVCVCVSCIKNSYAVKERKKLRRRSWRVACYVHPTSLRLEFDSHRSPSAKT